MSNKPLIFNTLQTVFVPIEQFIKIDNRRAELSALASVPVYKPEPTVAPAKKLCFGRLKPTLLIGEH